MLSKPKPKPNRAGGRRGLAAADAAPAVYGNRTEPNCRRWFDVRHERMRPCRSIPPPSVSAKLCCWSSIDRSHPDSRPPLSAPTYTARSIGFESACVRNCAGWHSFSDGVTPRDELAALTLLARQVCSLSESRPAYHPDDVHLPRRQRRLIRVRSLIGTASDTSWAVVVPRRPDARRSDATWEIGAVIRFAATNGLAVQAQ